MSDTNLIKSFLDPDGKVTQLPTKRKKLLCVLSYIAEKLNKNREYTEKEINEFINDITTFNDQSTVRRELIDFNFLQRTANGSKYWVTFPPPDYLE